MIWIERQDRRTDRWKNDVVTTGLPLENEKTKIRSLETHYETNESGDNNNILL